MDKKGETSGLYRNNREGSTKYHHFHFDKKEYPK